MAILLVIHLVQSIKEISTESYHGDIRSMALRTLVGVHTIHIFTRQDSIKHILQIIHIHNVPHSLLIMMTISINTELIIQITEFLDWNLLHINNIRINVLWTRFRLIIMILVIFIITTVFCPGFISY